MLKYFIATCFGSCAKGHHQNNKILKESYYVKHLILFYTASQASYISSVSSEVGDCFKSCERRGFLFHRRVRTDIGNTQARENVAAEVVLEYGNVASRSKFQK
jgi:hypothetical protein